MRSTLRLTAALALTALCAPGTWLRTHVPDTMPAPEAIAMRVIAGPSATGTPGWQVEGVWQYWADSLNFGGFSGMLTIGKDHLRVFSDRGVRFTFTRPDRLGEVDDQRKVSHQLAAREHARDLWDIEAATRDPVSRDYWLAFENLHAIQRYSVASEPEAVVLLGDQVDWPKNAGAEALVRLGDGRFVIIPESRRQVLVFADDPVEGARAEVLEFENPAPGFVVTDMSELPDGRLLLLMRDVKWGYPPFASLLALADPPDGTGAPIAPEVVLDFAGIIPRENYEAMALAPNEDGTIALWVMADSNKSIMQRDLLVKLRFDPDAAEDAAETDLGAP